MKNAAKLGVFLLLGASVLTCSLCAEDFSSNKESSDAIERYYRNFELLVKKEDWQEILSQGLVALDWAKVTSMQQDEAKICAQLTSTSFYLGNYDQALIYANRCHELSKEFVDLTLFIRALYLESAVNRALAVKQKEEATQDAFYQRAVKIAEEALCIYSSNQIDSVNLLGKIYFNLGAAHADNPKGDLEKAFKSYSVALDSFRKTNANDDVIRTSLRLGKIHLLQKKYELAQKLLVDMRPLITSERIAMHADYLEAQLAFATYDFKKATKIANHALITAKKLNAKEDELRLTTLLQKIENSAVN